VTYLRELHNPTVARSISPTAMKLARILLLPICGALLAACTQALSTPPARETSAPTRTSNPAPVGDLGMGSTQVSPSDNMTVVYVPAGSFQMGTDLLTDEQPVHTVTLDSFWLDQTEVTNDQYRLCVEAGNCLRPSVTSYYDDPGYASHPVAFVSWSRAQDYCGWAGRRLPTEAEWEKAATWDPSTNEKYVYPWGNIFDCTKGNFDDEIDNDDAIMPGSHESCDGFPETAPVGSFPSGASPYTALDMGGNVWEWVHDAFIEVDPLTPSFKNYYAISPEFNPQGVDPSITDYRSMRGGSWNWTFGFGRAAYRLWYGLDDSYDAVGFRCAQSAD
jgi:eukaryotic-like serine/threonine-protein kinase